MKLSALIVSSVVTLNVVAWYLALTEEQPKPGWCTQATVVSVYDGDTCTVEVRRRFKIRLEDVWAPEIREKGGIESRDHLRSLIDQKAVMIRIGGTEDVWRRRTFGRDVGRIWVEGNDVGSAMIESGHAFKTKAELRENQK